MKIKHYTIPIFIPELACPFQCVFCNQKKITGRQQAVEPAEAGVIIEQYLSTYKQRDAIIQVGFFGGNFTGLPLSQQEEFLKAAGKYLERGLIHGIRLSTRPDYITPVVVELLRRYNVSTVELGAQSMDDQILRSAGRGHKAADTIRAAGLIRQAGIKLGLQMMAGLPGDTKEKALNTAKEFITLGADNTRIYPALVIRDTALARLYENQSYTPLPLAEAVEWCSELYELFENNNVTVIKLGLHPSEGFLRGDELLAGPFHVSFRELVLSAIWLKTLSAQIDNRIDAITTIFTAPDQINYAVGYNGTNRTILSQRVKHITFKKDSSLSGREFNVMYS